MTDVCPHCGAEWETEDGLSYSHAEENELGWHTADIYHEYRRCKGNPSHQQIREWIDEPVTDFGAGAHPQGEWEDLHLVQVDQVIYCLNCDRRMTVANRSVGGLAVEYYCENCDNYVCPYEEEGKP